MTDTIRNRGSLGLGLGPIGFFSVGKVGNPALQGMRFAVIFGNQDRSDLCPGHPVAGLGPRGRGVDRGRGLGPQADQESLLGGGGGRLGGHHRRVGGGLCRDCVEIALVLYGGC